MDSISLDREAKELKELEAQEKARCEKEDRDRLERAKEMFTKELIVGECEKPLSVYCMTWNLYEKVPPDDFISHLNLGKHDIYALGTQECEKSIAKSVFLHTKNKWEAMLDSMFTEEGYVKVRFETLVAIHLAVYVRTELNASAVRRVTSSTWATGLGNVLGNKGGCGVALDVGNTSFAFLTSHFHAHESKVDQRNADYHKINNKLRLRKGANPISEKFDRVFWTGDLNYRVMGNRHMVDMLLEKGFTEVMVANDELQQQMAAGVVFNGFTEGPLLFPPTYKFDKGSDVYDTSYKARIPSWTDRVLWKDSGDDRTCLRSYDSIRDVRTSDHRAVCASFDTTYEFPTSGDGELTKPANESVACVVM